jgi:hypothetical protein
MISPAVFRVDRSLPLSLQLCSPCDTEAFHGDITTYEIYEFYLANGRASPFENAPESSRHAHRRYHSARATNCCGRARKS